MSTPTGSQPAFSGTLPKPPQINLPHLAYQGARPAARPSPSAPVVLTPPGAVNLPPVILQPKSTTLYVGKIAASVGDDVIKQLLEACGPVKAWKRMEDPETKEPKPFGFCEFEEAEGVIRAMNLLNNLAVGGQELLLKCNSQTTKYIDSIEASKAQRIANGQQPAAAESEESAEEADNQALEKIMALISAHAPSLPPPPSKAAVAADSFLAQLKEEADSQARQDRSRDRHRRRDSRPRDDERSLEASFQREKERERREIEARQQEQDSVYKSALRKWEGQESERRKQHEREKEHEKDRVKERDRLLKADLDGSEIDEEVWRRKVHAGSRRAADRKRRREKENQEDDLDREEEAEEAAKRAKLEEKAAAEAAEAAANGHESPAPVAAGTPRLDDPNDSITQAMLNAAKAPRKSPKAGGSSSSPQPLPGPPRREPAPRPAGKSRAVLAAFGGDEEEEQPKRMLKPITYTEEEQKAAQVKPEDKAAAIDELISRVPTEMSAVKAYAINWPAFDQGGPELRDKISKWVLKRTTELLGEEEASMVDFIMNQLQEHVTAPKLLEELQAVLDEEADPFVFKLFRMVIFETLKQAAGLSD